MGNPYFRLKQFTVWHDKCAMKVGTDGVLLGAWAGQGNTYAGILDIGTGSGLVALMLAQRFPEARITALDIDNNAALQAGDNFAISPWRDRLRAVNLSIQDFCRTARGEVFDLIVSNPPFYDTSLTNPDVRKGIARHTGSLTHEELLLLSAGLLSGHGVFSLIIPCEAWASIAGLAERSGLYLHRRTLVCSKPGTRPKRVLAEFGRCPADVEDERILTIQNQDGSRSMEYVRLVNDFYLGRGEC